MGTLLLDRLLADPPAFLSRFPSPSFVVDEGKLRRNAAILDSVQHRTGAKILLALKGFAMWDVFPLLSRALEGGQGPLYGCCASSPDEARLAREMFGGEVHAFAAGYSENDMLALVRDVDHLVFNSFAQWRRFRETVRTSPRGATIACGLRVNPEHSEGAVPIYDPCSPESRLGIRLSAFEEEERQGRLEEALEGVSGLHFHTLCEQGADALSRTLDVFEEKFGRFLTGMRWVNFGGGHHITREDYDLDLLCTCIARVRDRYGVQVYLEPGEAVALNAGILISTVLDVVNADMPVAILDTSAAAHMPDVLSSAPQDWKTPPDLKPPDRMPLAQHGLVVWPESPALPETQSANTHSRGRSFLATGWPSLIWPFTAWSKPQHSMAFAFRPSPATIRIRMKSAW